MLVNNKIRILRPYRETGFISADAFEHVFARNLAPDLQLHPVSQQDWFTALLGPRRSEVNWNEAVRRLPDCTRGFQFYCPAYEAQPLAPLFLALRNRSGAPIRLLFIAHAPGTYLLEWILMRRLLRSGDLIVAPSESARRTICFLCPELEPHIRVIAHPMPFLPRVRTTPENHIVTLARIHPDKLLHRQIEAAAELKQRGTSFRMHIAGPLNDQGSAKLHSYARCLARKIERLGLVDCVQLVGLVKGDVAKARLLARARLMVYLSVTIEEAFPKASVESLGMGVPVLATRWDGFPETVGKGGHLLHLTDTWGSLALDVSATEIADAIQTLFASPPPGDLCREHASRFLPETIRPRYRETLEEAWEKMRRDRGSPDEPGAGLDEQPGSQDIGAAPVKGLLAVTAPLTIYSWQELFRMHLKEVNPIRGSWAGDSLEPSMTDAARLRGILLDGVRKPLERFLAGLDHRPWTQPVGQRGTRRNNISDLASSLSCAAGSRATRTSRQTCLAALAAEARDERLKTGLEQMTRDGIRSVGLSYLMVDCLRAEGRFADAFRWFKAELNAGTHSEHAALLIRQLARICREWGRPALALPTIRSWLQRHPDSPDSGAVWIDRCLNAFHAGHDPRLRLEAARSLERAKALLGESPIICRIHRIIHAAAENETHRDPTSFGNGC